MKLWLDEARTPPSLEWLWARDVANAKTMVRRVQPVDFTACSLDHDLSFKAIFELAPSGLTFVRWMIYENVVPARVEIHSQNPVGALMMRRALRHAGYGDRTIWRPYHG